VAQVNGLFGVVDPLEPAECCRDREVWPPWKARIRRSLHEPTSRS
jgi:hypothetical protein